MPDIWWEESVPPKHLWTFRFEEGRVPLDATSRYTLVFCEDEWWISESRNFIYKANEEPVADLPRNWVVAG